MRQNDVRGGLTLISDALCRVIMINKQKSLHAHFLRFRGLPNVNQRGWDCGIFKIQTAPLQIKKAFNNYHKGDNKGNLTQYHEVGMAGRIIDGWCRLCCSATFSLG
ncbi:hypothetical protein H2248_012165 [Termitomyces sp. 'cryptogamus']|nr:hypothetical protein H2248_012165 [Termitomyces sp. 'cryptogamus']